MCVSLFLIDVVSQLLYTSFSYFLYHLCIYSHFYYFLPFINCLFYIFPSFLSIYYFGISFYVIFSISSYFFVCFCSRSVSHNCSFSVLCNVELDLSYFLSFIDSWRNNKYKYKLLFKISTLALREIFLHFLC